MNPKFKLVWLSSDLEGYQCVDCGYQTLDPDEYHDCHYWYEYVEEECVLCGRYSEYKYRVYNRPKPEEWWDRHHRREYACGDHFL